MSSSDVVLNLLIDDMLTHCARLDAIGGGHAAQPIRVFAHRLQQALAQRAEAVADGDGEEDAYVIQRTCELLARIAIIVNGPEPPLTRWSYHDLPEKVQALKNAHPVAAQGDGRG